MSGTDRRPEVAVALDVPGREEALDLVRRLEGLPDYYKVGLELFLAEGPSLIQVLAGEGHRIFLDLKLHDISATVVGAVRSAAATGAELLTVHAAGGGPMMEAAARAARGAGREGGVRVVAVTLLTSLDAAEAGRIWGRQSLEPEDEAVRLARTAVSAGLDGVVCSALEVRRLREALGAGPLLVTPGIRPAGVEAHDQSRTATPAAATRAGADVLVLGRAVTRADDPRSALERILDEVRRAGEPA